MFIWIKKLIFELKDGSNFKWKPNYRKCQKLVLQS